MIQKCSKSISVRLGKMDSGLWVSPSASPSAPSIDTSICEFSFNEAVEDTPFNITFDFGSAVVPILITATDGDSGNSGDNEGVEFLTNAGVLDFVAANAGATVTGSGTNTGMTKTEIRREMRYFWPASSKST